MFKCNECGRRVDWIDHETKLCFICYNELHDNEEIQVTLPGDVVAFWYGEKSYMDKKKNRAYFRILPEFMNVILDNQKYLIIIKKIQR